MKKIVASASMVLLCVSTVLAQNNRVAFDNQSGELALVKLIGPTQTEIEVPPGAKVGTAATAGKYIIKVRYGTPGAYHYSKGDEFEVKETATTASDITITLHKVVAGNYDAVPISEEEFGPNSTSRAGRTNPKEGQTSGTTAPPVASVERAKDVPSKGAHTNDFTVSGSLLDRNNKPVPRVRVFFFGCTDSQVFLDIQNGEIASPSTLSDTNGHFAVRVPISFLKKYKAFTLGLFNCDTQSAATLTRGGIPDTFLVDVESNAGKIFDAGTVKVDYAERSWHR
jgi:hypothetical protein